MTHHLVSFAIWTITVALNKAIGEGGSSLLVHPNHKSGRRARLYKREGVVLIRSEGIINVPFKCPSPSLMAKSVSFPSLTSGALEVLPFPHPQPKHSESLGGGSGWRKKDIGRWAEQTMSLTYLRSVMFQKASSVVWCVQNRNIWPLTSLLARESVYQGWFVSVWDDFLQLFQASDSGNCPCSWTPSTCDI